jgi:hypothetical protein
MVKLLQQVAHYFMAEIHRDIFKPVRDRPQFGVPQLEVYQKIGTYMLYNTTKVLNILKLKFFNGKKSK